MELPLYVLYMKKQNTLDRFMKKVDKNGPVMPHMDTECWTWLAAKNAKGYGKFLFNGENSLAHRVSCTLHNIKIPSGMCACHKCDNRACVNPEHIFIGTILDNTMDMVKKGRQRGGNGLYGETNKQSKITEDDVKYIRNHPNTPLPKLAEKFNVGKGNIWMIRHNKTWKHLL